MLYRFLEPGEIESKSDVYTAGRALRPVPEPRPVEDLTEEERGEIYNVCGAGAASVNCIVKTIDEIRARPRESAKEKWIREKMAKVNRTPNCIDYERVLEMTWDAAYEAGRGER